MRYTTVQTGSIMILSEWSRMQEGGKMTALNRYGGEIEAQRSASLLQMQVMILSGFVESRAFFGGRLLSSAIHCVQQQLV